MKTKLRQLKNKSMNQGILSVDRLKELLFYREEDGVFIWKTTHGKMRAGSIAGSVGGRGYLNLCIDSKNYRAHRLAWLYVHGEFPKDQIDHRDGNKLNNRIDNLRSCSCSDNAINTKVRSDNSSGIKGVYYNKRQDQWVARIGVKGYLYNIGTYDSKQQAINARVFAESIMHGLFSYKCRELYV